MGKFSSAWTPKDMDVCDYINRIKQAPVPDRKQVFEIATVVCESKAEYRNEVLKWHSVLSPCLGMLIAFRDREIRPDYCFELSLRNSIRINQLRTEVEPVIDRLTTLTSRRPVSGRYNDSPEFDAVIAEVEALGIRLERLGGWFRISGNQSSIAEKALEKFVSAKQRLASTGLRLVAKIAYGYGRKHSLMDMIQDGNAGLLVAAEKFDPEMGCAFTTYASHWIHERISKGIQRRSTIRVPFEKLLVISKANRELALKAQYAQRQLNAEDEGEVVSKFPIDSSVFTKMKSGVTSLNHLLNGTFDENSASFDIEDGGQREPEHGMWDSMRQTAVSKALQKLDDRQKEIVALRFGFDGAPPRSRQYIGERIGLTGERVRQIEKETLRILRTELAGFED